MGFLIANTLFGFAKQWINSGEKQLLTFSKLFNLKSNDSFGTQRHKKTTNTERRLFIIFVVVRYVRRCSSVEEGTELMKWMR